MINKSKMKKKKNNKELFIFILGLVLIVSSMSMFMKPSITGAALAAGGTAKTSNATISTSTLSCSFNDTSDAHNLSYGISFGSVDPNSADNPALGNKDGTGTNYSIVVGSSNTANIDMWIKADTNLTCHTGTGNCTDGVDIIDVDGNYSYDDSTTINGPSDDNNWLSGAWEIADSTNVAPDSIVYWRFWLNVPFGQDDGQYNNTITFLCNKTSS